VCPDWANFRPFGHFFSLGSLLKITVVAHIFGNVFHGKNDVIGFSKKTGWATFSAIFSLTHLVAVEIM
jgi:hypothetical protein